MNTNKGTSIIFVRCNNDEPEVLLFLRDNKDTIPYPDCWDILGGHVESGETPEECIVREMLEEIEIDIGTPELFDIYRMNDRIEYTYWKYFSRDAEDIQLNEGQKLRWFTEKEIRDMKDEDISFGFRQVLIDFFNSKKSIAGTSLTPLSK